MNSISNSQLVPGKSVFVIGEVVYSRITSQIAGAELAELNKTQLYPKDRPYTTITLSSVQIQPESGDSNDLSINEQYIAGKCYQSKTHPERGWCVTLDNKGDFLPKLCQGVTNPDGTISGSVIDNPDGELASGLKVMAIVNVFKGKFNCGISLSTVIALEPIRYYSFAGDSDLATRGINITGNAVKASSVVPQQSVAQNTFAQANLDDVSAFATQPATPQVNVATPAQNIPTMVNVAPAQPQPAAFAESPFNAPPQMQRPIRTY